MKRILNMPKTKHITAPQLKEWNEIKTKWLKG